MGPVKDLLGMLPGVGQQMAGMAFDEREFDRNQAIIRSMTLKERTFPEILNVSRRQRIACGAGASLDQVNGLLKNFKMMKKQPSFSASNVIKTFPNAVPLVRSLLFGPFRKRPR